MKISLTIKDSIYKAFQHNMSVNVKLTVSCHVRHQTKYTKRTKIYVNCFVEKLYYYM